MNIIILLTIVNYLIVITIYLYNGEFYKDFKKQKYMKLLKLNLYHNNTFMLSHNNFLFSPLY